MKLLQVIEWLLDYLVMVQRKGGSVEYPPPPSRGKWAPAELNLYIFTHTKLTYLIFLMTLFFSLQTLARKTLSIYIYI